MLHGTYLNSTLILLLELESDLCFGPVMISWSYFGNCEADNSNGEGSTIRLEDITVVVSAVSSEKRPRFEQVSVYCNLA